MHYHLGTGTTTLKNGPQLEIVEVKKKKQKEKKQKKAENVEVEDAAVKKEAPHG